MVLAAVKTVSAAVVSQTLVDAIVDGRMSWLIPPAEECKEPECGKSEALE